MVFDHEEESMQDSILLKITFEKSKNALSEF